MSEHAPAPAMRSEDAMRHTLATVLLVVDDAETLAQTRERLEAAGYRDVVSCSDSSRTEELLAAHEPDLLLLGPGRGAGILERLRANEMWRQLPVIVLVPEHDSDAKREALGRRRHRHSRHAAGRQRAGPAAAQRACLQGLRRSPAQARSADRPRESHRIHAPRPGGAGKGEGRRVLVQPGAARRRPLQADQRQPRPCRRRRAAAG